MTSGPFPAVPDSHAISREAGRHLLVRVPSTWTATDPNEGDDYGVDVTLNIAARGQITGRLAHLQLKGTRDPDNADRLRFRARTVRYLQSFTNIAMFVRVSLPEERYWIVPAHDERFREYLDRPDDSSEYSFRLSDHDLVAKEEIAQRIDVLSYRQWWLSRHRFGHVVAGQFVGDEIERLRATILDLRPFLPAWLSLDTIPPREEETLQALLELSTDGLLSVRDAARPTRTLELPPIEGATTEAPALLALQLALGFYDLGMRTVAAEIVVRAIPAHEGPLCESSRRLLGDAVRVFGDAAFRAIMLGSALQGREWCTHAILEYHFAYHDVPLSPEELLLVLEHATRKASRKSLAVHLFNWANLLHKAGAPARALVLNKRVPQEDASYRTKGRYWVQRAQIHLDLHEYDAADRAYRTAAEQYDFDPGEARVRRADVHMMAGNIDKAREAMAGEFNVREFSFDALRKVITFVVTNWSDKSRGLTPEHLTELLVAIPPDEQPRRTALALALALIARTPHDWANALKAASASPSKEGADVFSAAFTWSASRYGGDIVELLRTLLPDEQQELATLQASLDAMQAASRPRTITPSDE